MRFRTAIVLTIVFALTSALVATTLVVSSVLTQATRRQLESDLARQSAAFADMLRYRKSLHRAETRMLADEPRLKAVAATDDVTQATVQGVVLELKRALRCDLFVITDREGRVIADSEHAEAEGASLIDNPVVSAALSLGESDDLWLDENTIYQVYGRRLAFGSTTVGAVVTGYKIDDALAESLSHHLGADLVLFQDRHAIAASKGLGLRRSEGSADWPSVSTAGAASFVSEIEWQGTRRIVLTAQLPDYTGKRPISYSLVRSLDQAMAPARKLLRILYALTAASLLISLALAFALSRLLSAPIDDLVAFAHRIADGKLQPAGIKGMREVQLLGEAMDQMVQELAASRSQIAEKTRLAKEMEIAERIQLSILPRTISVRGLQISAQMLPASEVGGDYYDVIPCPDGGCYVGIGDVAGHGLPAGLVMLMVQSALSALVRGLPNATPRELVATLNRLLFDNIRNRMHSDEHVTFMVARYYPDGRFVYAGAHETMVLLRRGQTSCELVDTVGTWLAIIDDIATVTKDQTLHLQEGDVLCLYTDGVTESFDERRQQFGLSGLCRVLLEHRDRSIADMQAAIVHSVRSWSASQSDDLTLLLLRREEQDEQR